MYTQELTKEQLAELKQSYFAELVNEDNFAEFFGTDYNEPSWSDIANVDDLISDEFVIACFEGISFVPEDFFCSTVEGGF